MKTRLSISGYEGRTERVFVDASDCDENRLSARSDRGQCRFDGFADFVMRFRDLDAFSKMLVCHHSDIMS